MFPRLVAAVLAVLLCLPTHLHADEAADLARARALYDEAQAQYSLGKFDRAIELYEEAYQLSKRPSLLFNIAQSHRLGGNPSRAKFFYESYLRAQPDAGNRAEIEAWITEMDAAIAREAEQAKKQPPPPPPPVDEPPSRKVGRPALTYAGYGMAGAGLVGIGLGVFFGQRAKSHADKVESATTVWTPEHEDAESAGPAANRMMYVMYGVGGALLVGGVVLWVLGRPRVVEGVAVTPIVDGKQVGVSFGGSF